MIDAYITTTGERWTVDNDGAMCLADKSGVAAYLIHDQRIYAELRALCAQRVELLAALEHLYNCSGSEEAYEQARTTLERVARREEAKGEA